MADGPAIVYYGARFDHAAVAARPIVGTVRDKDSGLPIAGVRITGMPNIPNSLIPTPGVEATSDARGRYEVRGLSPTLGFKLFTEAPAGQPYVNCGFISPKAEPGPGPFVFDLALEARRARARPPDRTRSRARRPRAPSPITRSGTTRTSTSYPELQAQQPGALGSSSPVRTGDSRSRRLPGRGLISARAPEDRLSPRPGGRCHQGVSERDAGPSRPIPSIARPRTSTCSPRSIPGRGRTRSRSTFGSIRAGPSRARSSAPMAGPSRGARDPNARRLPGTRASRRRPRAVSRSGDCHRGRTGSISSSARASSPARSC